ncbi:MAG: hypothetical protein HFE44_07320 [Oscillospiraceae bacterium]|nr:hypothetical protein [Oscillospiraceae bacterium]
MAEKGENLNTNDGISRQDNPINGTSADDCHRFIRECGYFFLATAVENQPKLRPFGMLHSSGGNLFIATDQRKQVYTELSRNPRIEIAAYNPQARRWIRITGRAEPEHSLSIKAEMMGIYPSLKQKYQNEKEMFLTIFKLTVDKVSIF